MSGFSIDIHVPSRKTPTPAGRHIDAGLAGGGRPELALAIAEHGVRPIFSRGGSYDFEHDQLHALSPHIRKNEDGIYEVTVEPIIVALGTIHAIRNVSKALGNGVPELNHPVVRGTTRDKVLTNRLLEKHGLAKAYAPLDHSQGIDSALDTLPADQVVLKPRNGMRSQGIHIGAKADLSRLYTEGAIDLSQDWILEERLDFSPPMLLKGIDEENQSRIDFANQHKLPKELRIYTFGRDDHGRLITSAVMRSARQGDTHFDNDDWVYIDPTSIPDEVLRKTDEFESTLSEHTGVREMHLGVDWTFARSQMADDPMWLPMEVNSGEPQLVYEHENPGLASEQSHLLASQLYRIATRHSTL